MKILLLDDDETIEQNLEYFLKIEKNWNYTKLDFPFDEKKELDFSDIDLVIVDFVNSDYEALLNQLTLNNLEIKIIIVSDVLKNSVAEGCHSCRALYNRKRLIKPCDPSELYTLIKDFDAMPCACYDAFDNIQSILSIILKRFTSLVYNEESKVVSRDMTKPSSRHTLEFVSLVNILEQNNINYKIDDTFAIKLL